MKIAIVDGNPLLWRAVEIFANLRTKTGIPTGCLFGAMTGLIRGLKDTKVDSYVVCWDVGKSRWRRELSPIIKWTEINCAGEEIKRTKGYKWDREESSDPLPIPYEAIQHQFGIVQKLIAYAGIPQFGVQGVEADDLVGILSSGFSQLGNHVVLLSSDHDFHQLINERVTQYDPVAKKWWDIPEVKHKNVGLEPHQLNELKAIIGDGGDCIVGVKGLGPSGVAKIFKRFGNLEIALHPDNQDEIRKMGKKFEQFPEKHDVIRLSYQLVTIPTVDNHSQLNQDEVRDFQKQLVMQYERIPLLFAGLADQYELTRLDMDILFRDPPSFQGFEKWFPSS